MKVTVMMAVYNGGKYIGDCIKSIVRQAFSDFELLVIDDGSTDNTRDVIRSFDDPRIRLICNNHDYIVSLNIGLRESRGEYIARMDADDVMYPLRLEEQVCLMDSHPEIAACGTWARTFGAVTFDIQRGRHLVRNPLAELLLKNMFTHPTMMLRKSFFDEHGLTYKEYPYAEDYKLWLDIALCGGKFWVIPQPLLSYRISKEQVSCVHCKEQDETTLRIQNEALLAILNDEKCREIEALQNIYGQLEGLNGKRLLTADMVRQIVYEIYKNLKSGDK